MKIKNVYKKCSHQTQKIEKELIIYFEYVRHVKRMFQVYMKTVERELKNETSNNFFK